MKFYDNKGNVQGNFIKKIASNVKNNVSDRYNKSVEGKVFVDRYIEPITPSRVSTIECKRININYDQGVLELLDQHNDVVLTSKIDDHIMNSINMKGIQTGYVDILPQSENALDAKQKELINRVFNETGVVESLSNAISFQDDEKRFNNELIYSQSKLVEAVIKTDPITARQSDSNFFQQMFNKLIKDSVSKINLANKEYDGE